MQHGRVECLGGASAKVLFTKCSTLTNLRKFSPAKVSSYNGMLASHIGQPKTFKGNVAVPRNGHVTRNSLAHKPYYLRKHTKKLKSLRISVKQHGKAGTRAV